MCYEKEIKDKIEYPNKGLERKKEINNGIFIIILSLIIIIQFICFSIMCNSQDIRFKFYKKCSTAEEAVNMYIQKGWGYGWRISSEDSRGCLHPIYSMSGILSVSNFQDNIYKFKLDDIHYYHSFEILTENKADKDKINELEYYIEHDIKQIIKEQNIDSISIEDYNSFLNTHNFEMKNVKTIRGRFLTSRRCHLNSRCNGNHKFDYVNFSCDVVEWKSNWYVLKFDIKKDTNDHKDIWS